MPRFNDNFYDNLIISTSLLNKHHIKYVEQLRGKIVIGTISYYSTSNKWIDDTTGCRGIGVNTLVDYIERSKQHEANVLIYVGKAKDFKPLTKDDYKRMLNAKYGKINIKSTN